MPDLLSSRYERRVEPTDDPEQNKANVEEAMALCGLNGGGTVVLAAGEWAWPEDPLQWINGVVLRGERE